MNKLFKKCADKVQKAFEICFRNRIILSYVNYPAHRNRVNLNWAPLTKKSYFKIYDKSKIQNLGDYLALPIFEYMTDINKINRNKKISSTKHLYTIGSLIMLGYQDATIWGSGILFSEPEGLIWKRSRYRKLDLRCVRGPETLKRLQENGYDISNCKIGDPGVLMPLVYKPVEYAEKKDYSVIIHMSKDNDTTIKNRVNILTDDWKKTIDIIYNSKLIISSSLHGIIIAEAYGIPAILLRKMQFDNDLFKYNDYYYSTGRYTYPIADTIEQALSMDIPPVPDVSVLQNNLLSSFPTDLWE